MGRGERTRQDVAGLLLMVAAAFANAWWESGRSGVSWPVRVAVSAAAFAAGAAAGVPLARRVRNGARLPRSRRTWAGLGVVAVTIGTLRAVAPVAGAMVLVAGAGLFAVVPPPSALDRRDHSA